MTTEGAPRVLDDALDPDNIPLGARAVAYYTDVLTPEQAAARWPNALLVSIDRVPDQVAGLVDDCESGAIAVSQLPARAAAKRAAGISDPWVYCSRAPWPAVQAAFTAAGVAQPLYWIADPGPLQLLAGTVATQCLYLGTYDQSALAAYVPGLDPPEDKMTPEQAQQLADLWNALGGSGIDPNGAGVNFLGWSRDVTAALAAIQTRLSALEAAAGAGPLSISLSGTATPAAATSNTAAVAAPTATAPTA